MKASRAVKWIIMSVWLWLPVLMKSRGIYIIPEALVIPWVAVSWLFSMATALFLSFKMMNHLKTHYPAKYKEISEFNPHSARQRDVSKRTDMALLFSPENDPEYYELKKSFRGSYLFMWISVICAVCAFVIYAF